MFRPDISGIGLLDIGVGTMDKVLIRDGKLVDITLIHGLYANIHYNGICYTVKNQNEVWDIEDNRSINKLENPKNNSRYYYLNGVKTLLD